jgi:hypothetical protein
MPSNHGSVPLFKLPCLPWVADSVYPSPVSTLFRWKAFWLRGLGRKPGQRFAVYGGNSAVRGGMTRVVVPTCRYRRCHIGSRDCWRRHAARVSSKLLVSFRSRVSRPSMNQPIDRIVPEVELSSFTRGASQYSLRTCLKDHVERRFDSAAKALEASLGDDLA